MRTRARRFQKGSIAKRKRKDGTTMLLFRWLDGECHRSQPLGLADSFPTPADLQRAVNAKQAEINSPDAYKFSSLTVSGLFEMFMGRHVKVHARKLTVSVYQSLFDVHIRPVWGDYLLSQVKTAAVESWLEALPKSDSVKSHLKGLLHSLFEYGVKFEFLDKNPIDRIRQTRRRGKTPRILTPGEFQALLGQLTEPCKTMVAVCGGLGLRVSELLGLRWGDVNFGQLEITISRSLSEGEVNDTKTEASRAALPLTVDLGEVLLKHRASSAYQGDEDYIFAGPTGQPPWPDSILSDHLKPAARKAGIVGVIGWHTFRRTFSSLIHAQGTGLAVQRELLRHADIRTTMNIYTQGIPADKREAIDKLGELLNKR
jgi:integrase